ncbi:hypothetical protein GQ457_14G012000 [Hibiscus cannabinus]
MSFHFKLRSVKKGNLGMYVYILKVNEVFDALASCASHVSAIDHIATILNGLPNDYKSFVAIITTSCEDFSIYDVTIMLVDAEAQQNIYGIKRNLVILEKRKNTLMAWLRGTDKALLGLLSKLLVDHVSKLCTNLEEELKQEENLWKQKVDGTWCTDQDELQQLAIDFYRSLFTSDGSIGLV